ncbi:uncharacterized acetyltransferase At3g50280-like [Papaver somniferum]|uniref:uncharacterized acetyltransferase At3g50280-like n=1 Tax=Papaver somniferum TaxID=3469 RepID=UPI000E6FAD66|nr:uncharacterized acetyltransferase At3g50280-like [Papaver somniferum]
MFTHETVRHISTSSILPCIHPSSQPAKATSGVDVIDLNPWDLNMLPFQYMQRGFLFTDIKHREEKPVDVFNHLKNSFSRTLEYFYPLAGRLAIRKHEDDETISMYIDCKNSTGAEFICATTDITASDLLDSSYEDLQIVHKSFFPLNGVLNHEGQSHPLLSMQTRDILTSPLEERIFNFKQESITRLKTKAKLEISDSSITTTVSSLQALFAHVWLATTRARKLDPNEETSFWLSIGNRSRMNPPMPEAYFGNSLQHGVANAKAGELLEKGLGWAALLLNQVIVSYDNDSVLNIWKSWTVKPSFMFTGNSPPPKNILVSGGSPRFNVYDNDFGWGKPVAVRTGRSSHYDGRVLPSRGVVEGSIDLEVCLCREIMKAIEEDKEFMDHVTILSTPSV